MISEWSKIQYDVQKFKKTNKTGEQLLAAEIYEWAGKKLNFGMLMKFIKENGQQAIREIFEETKKSDCEDPSSFFIWSVKKNKTVWIDKN